MAEHRKAMLIGRNVFAGLAVLTLVEYLVAIGMGGPLVMVLLFFLALAKSWLIVIYFMHIGQLRRREP